MNLRTPPAHVALLLAALTACDAPSPQSEPPNTPTAEHPAPVAGATRLQLRLRSCLPVGYGIACAGEVGPTGDPTPARLEACVGDGDPRGLSTWLEQEVHHGTPPVSLTIDVVPAPDSARHCGILILDSGAHHRVVAFARAP